MTPHTELEIHGNFLANPFAELLTEIMQARLDGSLRVSHGGNKCVIYFKYGRVVFAVSNARASRLFAILLRKNKISETDLAQLGNFASDFELAAILEEKEIITRKERDLLFCEQIESIILDLLSWPEGVWAFSALARVRDGLSFDPKVDRLLLDHGRSMSPEVMLTRFRSLDESFQTAELSESDLALLPDEAFVLSRANDGSLTAADIIRVAAMSEIKALHTIYVLWLCGLLARNDWHPAFTTERILSMKNARLAIKTEAQMQQFTATTVDKEKPAPVPEDPPAVAMPVEEYLQRVENAKSYYEILGVSVDADISELKRAYFTFAKSFHPDHFHAEGGETLQRIQNAFTQLAHAHETLKNAEAREGYDYRMREQDGNDAKADLTAGGHDQAEKHFEKGLDLLMEDEYEAALPFLARAVHFAPKTARYHAYYGKALSADIKKRHKAEAEIQTALKLDPNDPTFRLLLSEFYIKFNLLKRAEGELTRLLALFPSHREAQTMLEGLRK
ncbi:MAG: DnaJ domain-containing protein [Acidobacteriota bacterium]